MVDVRGDVLRPPHGTTPAAVKSNENQKWDPLRAMKKFNGTLHLPPYLETKFTWNEIITLKDLGRKLGRNYDKGPNSSQHTYPLYPERN